MVKFGPKPNTAASRRNRRADSAWKVPIHRPRGSAPSSAATRARISPAALLVNVTAKMRDGATPRSRMRCAIRAVSTRVLPEPAPASTRSGPPGWRTAASCWGLSARLTDGSTGGDHGELEHKLGALGPRPARRLPVDQAAAVLLLDDAPREREADAPPSRFGP